MIRKKPLKKPLSLFLTTALIFSSIATLFVLPPAISTGAVRVAATGCTPQTVETTLIIDSSGSMYSTDPTDLRKSASKMFIDQAQIGDKTSVVDFDDGVNTWAAPTVINSNTERTTLKAAVDQVDSSGLTAIGSGLQRGYDELNKSTTPTRKVGILLTDGDETAGSWNNQHLLFKAKGWPVYTIGLSSYANKALLKQIADQTGGKFYDAPDSTMLQLIYSEVSQAVGCGSSIFNKTAKMSTGQSWSSNINTPSVSQVTFSSSWPGSDTTLEITNPSGTKINSTDSSVYYVKASTYEIYRITSPAAGKWKVKITANSISTSGGENVNIIASSSNKVSVGTKISFSAKPKRVKRGRAALLKGKLIEKLNGQGVPLKQIVLKSGKKKIGTVTTDINGNFKKKVKVNRDTTFSAIFQGVLNYKSISKKTLLKVSK